MKKQWVASVLCAALLLSGCAAASSDPAGPGGPPASGQAPVPIGPAEPGGPEAPGEASGGAEPGGPAEPSEPAAPADPGDSGGQTGDLGEPAVPAGPEVTWRPRGIGYPLAPSDPTVERKVAMLTFDDGPSAYTPLVLDGLREAGVKAVFFITGYGAARYPEVVARIHEEGHMLGIHTMTHPNMTTLDREGQIAEIQPLIYLITEVTGEAPRYFRPPYGAYNDELLSTLADLALELINWSNGSLDWDGLADGYKDPNLVVQAVLDQLHPGSVILAHDTMKHTAEAVPLIVSALREQGYDFVVLP